MPTQNNRRLGILFSFMPLEAIILQALDFKAILVTLVCHPFSLVG